MKFELRRIVAMLLLLVTVTGLVMSFGEAVLCAGELPGAHDTANILDENESQDTSCPCGPSSTQSSSDHFCFGSCNGPCHAPLSSIIVTFAYSPISTCLSHAEVAKHIPEVHLSLFVPPDSASV
jgi:hypothetical protein